MFGNKDEGLLQACISSYLYCLSPNMRNLGVQQFNIANRRIFKFCTANVGIFVYVDTSSLNYVSFGNIYFVATEHTCTKCTLKYRITPSS